MKKKYLIFAAVIFSFFLLEGCRGDKSSQPPVLLIRNMVDQTSYGPQSVNEFYKDKRAARDPVVGTVAQGEAKIDSRLYLGIEPSSAKPAGENSKPNWVKKFPIGLSDAVLKRGQDRFNIYCSPCHGYDGNSDGLAAQASGGSIRPTNLHDARLNKMAVGEIYRAVTKGVNQWVMPGFAEQMSVQDAWAVVAYVRALQISHHASEKDVPKGILK